MESTGSKSTEQPMAQVEIATSTTMQITKEDVAPKKEDKSNEIKTEMPKEEPKPVEPKKEEPKPVEPKKEEKLIEIKPAEFNPIEKAAVEIKAPDVKKTKEEDDHKVEEEKQVIEAISSLPENVKPCFIAIKTITDQHDRLDLEYAAEMELLDKKYDDLRKPLYLKRQEIISGARNPTEEETKEKAKFVGVPKNISKYSIKVDDYKDAKGIPEFWLRCFNNHPEIKEKIKPVDEPILKSLVDVKGEQLDGKDFKLIFSFAPNEYFENTQLSVKFDVTDEDEKKTEGTDIKWKEGKNVTKKAVKKRQKHKKSGAQRTITKEVEAESFFNFFKSMSEPTEDDDSDAADKFDSLQDNIDLGEIIMDDLVNDALYFYFNIVEKDSDGEASDKDDDDDVEDEEEEVEKPIRKKSHKKSKDKKDDSDKEDNKKKGEQAKDCKQQ